MFRTKTKVLILAVFTRPLLSPPESLPLQSRSEHIDLFRCLDIFKRAKPLSYIRVLTLHVLQGMYNDTGDSSDIPLQAIAHMSRFMYPEQESFNV